MQKVITPASWWNELGLNSLHWNPSFTVTYLFAKQPQISYHFLWNRYKLRRTRFAIYSIFIEFQRCTKIPINIDVLPIQPIVPPSRHPFFWQSCLYVLSKVFRRTEEAVYSRSGVNQMWIFKNSKELRCIRASLTSEFQPYNKHQVIRFSNPLYNYSSPRTKKQTRRVLFGTHSWSKR